MRWICQALLVVVLLHGCRDVAKAEDIGCPPPLPAAAKVAFEHKRSVLVVKTAGSPNHRGQDVVAAVGEPQVLIGKFAYGTTDKDIKDEGVEVFVQRHPPCGDWQLLGTARTSKDGEHGKVFGIEDDGGRVFFTVPEAERLPVGRYPVRMRLVGDGSEAAFALYVLERGTKVVLFDIDGTLTPRDREVTKEYLADLVSAKYEPKMRPDGPAVVKAWVGKGYVPVYVTGRPDALRWQSESWLEVKGFPTGIIHHTDTLGQALPTRGGVAAYKAAFLRHLTGQGLVIAAAYGNATTDIEAYGNAGVDRSRTYIIGPHGGKEGTVAVESYAAHLETLEIPAP